MTLAIAPPIVVVRRRIAAPAQELFDAWLDPAALAQWMRPGSTHRTTATVDARVGGRYEIVMEVDSRSVPHRGEYHVIDPPRRLVFTWKSPHTGPNDTLVSVEFLPVDSGTDIVITHRELPEGQLTGHHGGWTSALEKLAARYGSA